MENDGFQIILETIIEQRWVCTTASQKEKNGKKVFATSIGDKEKKELLAMLHHCSKDGKVKEEQAVMMHFEIVCAMHDLGEVVYYLVKSNRMDRLIEIATAYNQSKEMSMN